MASTPGWKDTSAYLKNAFLLVISFFLCRVLLNIYAFYHMLRYAWLPLKHYIYILPPYRVGSCAFLSVLAGAHIILNLVWFVLLLRAASRKLQRGKKKKIIDSDF